MTEMKKHIPVPGQKRQTDGCIALGEIYAAHCREVQQDLPHPDAQSNPSCMQTHLLFQYGEIRNESKDIAVYHGSFGHQRDAECLHPCAVR